MIKSRIAILFISFITILSITAYAQNENANWLIGETRATPTSEGVYQITFSDTGVVNGKIIPYDGIWMNGNSATYSSPETGELQLFSDGINVYDKNMKIIENGDEIYLTDYTKENFEGQRGLYHISCSYFIPSPGNNNILYYFNTQVEEDGNDGRFLSYYYRIEKVSEDSFQVLNVDSPNIYGDNFYHCRPLFIRHANGRDWWITVMGAVGPTNKIDYYLLDPDGVQYSHSQEVDVRTGIYQVSKRLANFNQNSTILSYIGGGNSEEYPLSLVMMEFNRCEGMFFNTEEQLIHRDSIPNFPPPLEDRKTGYKYSAISPGGKYLYIGADFSIYQYDLTDTAWYETKKEVFTLDTLRLDDGYENYAMVYGQDGRLYVTMSDNERWVGVIDKPHRRGKAAEFRLEGITLPEDMLYYLTTPSVIDFRMGPVDGSSCDTLGLDNNVEALFRHDVVDKQDGKVDFRDLSEYNPTSWSWDFDDGNTSQEQYPIHTYAEEGIYNVCLTVSNMNGSDTYCEDVVIDGLTATESISELKMNLYPNPVSASLITINNPEKVRGEYVLTDMQGETVKRGKVTGIGQQGITIPDLTAGTYIFSIESKDGVYSEKVVVQ